MIPTKWNHWCTSSSTEKLAVCEEQSLFAYRRWRTSQCSCLACFCTWRKPQKTHTHTYTHSPPTSPASWELFKSCVLLYLKVMCGTGLESFMEVNRNCSALTKSPKKEFPYSAVSLSTKASKQSWPGLNLHVHLYFPIIHPDILTQGLKLNGYLKMWFSNTEEHFKRTVNRT